MYRAKIENMQTFTAFRTMDTAYMERGTQTDNSICKVLLNHYSLPPGLSLSQIQGQTNTIQTKTEFKSADSTSNSSNNLNNFPNNITASFQPTTAKTTTMLQQQTLGLRQAALQQNTLSTTNALQTQNSLLQNLQNHSNSTLAGLQNNRMQNVPSQILSQTSVLNQFRAQLNSQNLIQQNALQQHQSLISSPQIATMSHQQQQHHQQMANLNQLRQHHMFNPMQAMAYGLTSQINPFLGAQVVGNQLVPNQMLMQQHQTTQAQLQAQFQQAQLQAQVQAQTQQHATQQINLRATAGTKITSSTLLTQPGSFTPPKRHSPTAFHPSLLNIESKEKQQVQNMEIDKEPKQKIAKKDNQNNFGERMQKIPNVNTLIEIMPIMTEAKPKEQIPNKERTRRSNSQTTIESHPLTPGVDETSSPSSSKPPKSISEDLATEEKETIEIETENDVVQKFQEVLEGMDEIQEPTAKSFIVKSNIRSKPRISVAFRNISVKKNKNLKGGRFTNSGTTISTTTITTTPIETKNKNKSGDGDTSEEKIKKDKKILNSKKTSLDVEMKEKFTKKDGSKSKKNSDTITNKKIKSSSRGNTNSIKKERLSSKKKSRNRTKDKKDDGDSWGRFNPAEVEQKEKEKEIGKLKISKSRSRSYSRRSSKSRSNSRRSRSRTFSSRSRSQSSSFSRSRSQSFSRRSLSFRSRSASQYGDEGGRKVFIGNLPKTVTKTDLEEIFDRYGPMAACYIPLSRTTGHPRDFGFIIYENARDAQAAIDAMNGYSLDRKELHVTAARPRQDQRNEKRKQIHNYITRTLKRSRSYSRSSTSRSTEYEEYDLGGRKLFIGNISERTVEADLQECFSEFGKIEKCYIPMDWQSKGFRNFAFLVFADRRAARKAVRHRSGVEFQGNVLSVSLAKARNANR